MVDIRTHKAGYSLVNKLHSVQSEAPQQNALGRLLGISPLTEETRPWYVGLKGEISVGATLDSLKKEGYTVLHSVPIGEKESDIDHVVITPSGLIYTINTKSHRGKKVVGYSNKIYVGGYKNEHLRNSRHEGQRVVKLFAPEMKKVVSLLVFVEPESIVIKQKTEVPLIDASKLRKYLVDEEKARQKQGISQKVEVERLSDSDFWVTNYVDELEHQDEKFKWFQQFQKTVNRRYVRQASLKIGLFLVVAAGVTLSVPYIPTLIQQFME